MFYILLLLSNNAADDDIKEYVVEIIRLLPNQVRR